ncbi:MAG: hypothetical protein ABJI96_21195 [Paracoccaceae bacterium]
MKRLILRFSGPVDRSTVRRLRKKLSKSWIVTTLLAVALYAAAATEPNLTGTWLDPYDPNSELEITHIGRKVTAVFAEVSNFTADGIFSFKKGDHSFSAKHTGNRAFDGTIELRWPKAVIDSCKYPDNTMSRELSFTASADFQTLFVRYVYDRVTYKRFAPHNCRRIQPRTKTYRLVRKN